VDGAEVVACKGAPETVARLSKLEPAALDALRLEIDSLASRGIRLLAVARGARKGPGELPDEVADLGLGFLGLVGFADPLRESVPQAVRDCHAAGIRVVMITGDHPTTARSIAAQAGLLAGTTLTGTEIAALDDAALRARVREAAIFARISPDQKLRIVEALKSNGEIVAMTGDGVNDAPALKAAHIGIAMGGRGTDVAREAASIVLLDDDFGSIVRAIRVGRRIYDNLRKAMGYILAIHVPIAGLALLPVLFGLPLMLTPMLIALLELIIDPACSVVLEAEREEADVMARAPRRPDSSLLSWPLLSWSVLQGCLAFALVAATFLVGLRAGLPEAEVRTLSFFTLVGANVALIFVNRTFSSSLAVAFGRPNRALWWGLGIAALVMTVILAVPGLRAFLDLAPLTATQLAGVAATGLALLAVLELAKRAWHARLAA
jgi:P-type Ca2+ transporter type 2C